MKSLFTKLMVACSVTCSAAFVFAAKEGIGGMPPSEFTFRTYQITLSNETKTVQLWPAHIGYDYTEARRWQGIYPDMLTASLHINTHELRHIFKFNEHITTFAYIKEQDENIKVVQGMDYNEYMTVFNAINESRDPVTRKVSPVLTHSVTRWLKVARKQGETQIHSCYVHDEEHATLEFKTKEGSYKFGRYDATKETPVPASECQQKIDEFIKNGAQ